MLNRSASLEIQQAFSKPCLVNLISKYTHPLFTGSLFSVSFAMIYKGADQTEGMKHVFFIVVPQFHEYSNITIILLNVTSSFIAHFFFWHLGDNCIQKFHLGTYIVDTCIRSETLVLRRRASGAVKRDFRTYIRNIRPQMKLLNAVIPA